MARKLAGSAGCCAAIVFLIVAPAAWAAPQFLASQPVSDATNNNGTTGYVLNRPAAMSQSGAVTFAWTTPWWGGEGAPGSSKVMTAQHFPGGGWSAPQPASGTGLSSNNYVETFMNDAGDAFVYWIQPGLNPGTNFLTMNTKPKGAADWGTPVPLLGLNHILVYDAGMDSAGETVGVVADNTGGTTAVHGIVRPAGGSGFTETTLSADSGFSGQVAVNAAGDAVAVWGENTGSGFKSVHPATRPRGGSWSAQPSKTGNPSLDVGTPQVAIDAAGNATAVWQQIPVGDDEPQIFAIDKAAGSATWTGPDQITHYNTGQGAFPPVIAMNRAGDTVVEFNDVNTVASAVVTRRAGGDWAGPTDLGVGTSNGVVALDGSGNFLVSNSAPGNTVNATVRSMDTPLVGSMKTVSPSDGKSWQFGAVAMIERGDGVVLFENPPQVKPSQIRAAAFDATGPDFTSIDFPSSATATVGFPYSATPVDIWSPIASTGWAFGDGTSADGASGTKAYASEGAFTATVTATDAAGNSRSANRPITVGPAPPGAPAPPGGGSPPDTTAPVFASASVSPKRFAVNRRGKAETPVAAAVKKGTTFRWTLSEDARVVVTIQRQMPGRRVGRTCRKPSAKNRRKKRCTRYVRAGRFAVASLKGANRHKFSGRIGRRSLVPGRYRSLLVARDAAGNASKARSLRFVVVRRG